jgi:hypoxanthine-guanine phosphoribosyltransferase
MSISEYIKNIDKINERLKDLLAEIISDMKSNMTFLAPLLSGIVVALSSMIISILNKLNITEMLSGGEATGLILSWSISRDV